MHCMVVKEIWKTVLLFISVTRSGGMDSKEWVSRQQNVIFLPYELSLQKDASFDCPYSSSVNQIALHYISLKMRLGQRTHSPEKQENFIIYSFHHNPFFSFRTANSVQLKIHYMFFFLKINAEKWVTTRSWHFFSVLLDEEPHYMYYTYSLAIQFFE